MNIGGRKAVQKGTLTVGAFSALPGRNCGKLRPMAKRNLRVTKWIVTTPLLGLYFQRKPENSIHQVRDARGSINR
jgi:hypothetical protein